VNVDIVLETLKSAVLEVDAWVNVIGYVTSKKPLVKFSGEVEEEQSSEPVANVTYVQAIVLWEAVAVKLDAYEKALQGRIWLGTTG
jgi:hypothetical protein